ncbi:UbiD family decarboxylase [Chlamydiales bacterium]|nr:UbiD family decarboxylase [Chlamydiales bacterium]
MRNLRELITNLREHNEIVDIFHHVDPYLELAEIHRRVIAANGPALLFHNVKGSSFPVVTNLFGSMKRMKIAFGDGPERFVEEMVTLATKEFPPTLKNLWKKKAHLKRLTQIGTKQRKKLPIQEVTASHIDHLPLITSWPEDGGPFITLPLVYTESLNGGPPNLGMYRIQRFNGKECGLHFQIGKGGGYHYYEAEKQNKPLPVSIFVGGPPALILSAIAPLPENVPELLLASLIQGKKLQVNKGEDFLIGECEFALTGEARPNERRDEGPFGDHYGYYSLKHPFPLFHLKKLYHRKNAIYPATIVGKPRQEDYYIGEYLQKLLSPLFPVVMPTVKDLWSYGETGFHSLGAAIIRERYSREAMTSAFRILGEGQLSLTKFLLLTDQPVDLSNFKEVLKIVLERFNPETDLFIFSNLSIDTLDYTGPELNKGSRGVLLGLGEKKRDLPLTFQNAKYKAEPYCPGCLVVENCTPEKLTEDPDLKEWPLIILVDSIEKTLKSDTSFLWTTFTRFEPGADIYSSKNQVHRHHILYSFPIVIDARMKPSYPKELFCDEKTKELVSKEWNHYFPKGMEMGDSDLGNLD